MAHFKYDESMVVLGSRRSSGMPRNIHLYDTYDFKINYTTDKGEEKVKYYSVFAYGRTEAHRKVGDKFRKEYPILRRQ